MRRSYITSAFAGALLLGLGTTAALAVTGEFNNMCTEGLALGKDIQTDCSINAVIDGKTYCFGSKEAMTAVYEGPHGQHGQGAGLLHKQASWLGCHFNRGAFRLSTEGPSAYADGGPFGELAVSTSNHSHRPTLAFSWCEGSRRELSASISVARCSQRWAVSTRLSLK